MGVLNVIGKALWSRPKNKANNQSPRDFVAGVDEYTPLDIATKVSVVYRCVNLLADTLGAFPVFLIDTSTQERPSDDFAKVIKYLLNKRPNADMTAFDFNKLMVANKLLQGNAYAQIKFGGSGIPVTLIPLDPTRVQIVQDGSLRYVYSSKDGQKTLYPHEVLHFKGYSEDGIEGQSVLAHAQKSIESLQFIGNYEQETFKGGGSPTAVLEYQGNFAIRAADVNKELAKLGVTSNETAESQLDRLQKYWHMHQKTGKVAITQDGVKYVAVPQINPKDMAFIESKELLIKDIARFFGVPLHLLYEGKQSYNSNEQNNIAFNQYTLLPIITTIEQELSYKLLPLESQLNGIDIKLNNDSLFRGDSLSRARMFQIHKQMGTMSTNEIRALEDRAKIENGDIYVESKNYAPLDQFIEEDKEYAVQEDNSE